MSCNYIPQISAEFGKTITDHEIDAEFQAIERAFDCFEEQIGNTQLKEENIYDYGIVDNSQTLDPAFGVLQYMELQGDVDLELSEPQEGDPRVITLVIANAGSVDQGNYGRFSFPDGTAWTADRDIPMDGKPWNMYANLIGDTSGTQYEGFYGAIVTCVHDGHGWLYMAYARHHLDINASEPNPDDIYDWR
jgi:hypothetical protein